MPEVSSPGWGIMLNRSGRNGGPAILGQWESCCLWVRGTVAVHWPCHAATLPRRRVASRRRGIGLTLDGNIRLFTLDQTRRFLVPARVHIRHQIRHDPSEACPLEEPARILVDARGRVELLMGRYEFGGGGLVVGVLIQEQHGPDGRVGSSTQGVSLTSHLSVFAERGTSDSLVKQRSTRQIRVEHPMFRTPLCSTVSHSCSGEVRFRQAAGRRPKATRHRRQKTHSPSRQPSKSRRQSA